MWTGISRRSRRGLTSICGCRLFCRCWKSGLPKYPRPPTNARKRSRWRRHLPRRGRIRLRRFGAVKQVGLPSKTLRDRGHRGTADLVPPRLRTWLRIFVVRCGLPTPPPAGAPIHARSRAPESIRGNRLMNVIDQAPQRVWRSSRRGKSSGPSHQVAVARRKAAHRPACT